jgi:hypothetical protein
MADPHGTVRRAPTGFAHAIRLDQGPHPKRWQVVDAYGPWDLVEDEEVQDWPVVYTPVPDEEWRDARV